MLRQKVLTVACALAILAFGACFFPNPRPPVQPLPPDLNGIRVVAIQVEDNSAEEPFDSVALSRVTAERFNRMWIENAVHAKPWQQNAESDATMHITLIRKSVTPGSVFRGRQGWTFQFDASFTLTGRDGSLLRRKSGQSVNVFQMLPSGSQPPTSNSRDVLNRTAYNLAILAGNLITSNQPQEHP